MGKSSNMRKSTRQPAGLVSVFSKGGITVRSKRAFPPELTHLVVHAFQHFINGRTGDGIKLVSELQSNGCDFFDFTMASTTNPLVGDSDPLIWAWGAASKSSLIWLTEECVRRGRIDLGFFAVLPHQLELTREGSELCQLGEEVFAMFAGYLLSRGVESGFESLFAAQAPRACAIFKGVVAERIAAGEQAGLSESTPLASCPTPLHTAPARRL